MARVRIGAYVTPELNDRLDQWSGKIGITKSQLIAMSIMAGLDSIVRAVSPVESVEPEQWAKIIEAMEKNKVQGLDMLKKEE